MEINFLNSLASFEMRSSPFENHWQNMQICVCCDLQIRYIGFTHVAEIYNFIRFGAQTDRQTDE